VTSLVFDCDGVLADTERYGHLPAFNATFKHFGLPVRWSVDDYAEKLKVGGGKERMATVLDDPEVFRAAGAPASDEDKADVLAQWHSFKTRAFTDLVGEGVLPARPGVRRVITAAVKAGWTVAVASTSAEQSVRAVLGAAVGEDTASRIPLFAGDVVPRKKPDPAVYALAVAELGLRPADTLVVEDSRNGLRASTGAGLRTLITVNGYTRDEDFSEGALVVSALGDPGSEPIEVLWDPYVVEPHPYVTLDHIESLIRQATAVNSPTA
jgi:HAD superfamily hydrolase (TIGR01509 family)